MFSIAQRHIRRLQKKKRALLSRQSDTDAKLYEVPQTVPSQRATSGLAAVIIVKDEAPYIQEWIEFHKLVGFNHFFFYDNGSTDGTWEILAEYQNKGDVTVLPWRDFSGILDAQKAANAHALANFCREFRWVAFFDIDEFLFSPTHETLVEPLAQFTDQPCICVPWFNFGPNGHEKKPSGPVIENYTLRAVFPPTVKQRSLLRYKTILDPTEVSAAGTHAFHFGRGGALLVNENGERFASYLSDDTRYAVSRNFQLNHYFTRSLEELENKRRKGRVFSFGKPKPDIASRRLSQYELATCEDTAILKHLPRLKEKLAHL